MALIAHELAQAWVAGALGGEPSLISSTGTRVEWSRLRRSGVLFVGVSGWAANAVVALMGWLLFRRLSGPARIGETVPRARRPTTSALVAWLLFAVNAWIPALYLVASPAFAFGDWTTIIDQFPDRGPLRASLAATGLFIAGLVWKETKASLARLVGNGSSADRTARARRIVRMAWLCGGGVAVAAGFLSPLGPTTGITVAAGGTFASTWPVLLAVGAVEDTPVPGSPLVVPLSWWVLVSGAVVALVLVGVFGPGLHLAS